MTCKEQLERWVAGESVHNDERDECCPDFSCCQPELLASEDERRAFKEAHDRGDENSIMAMLGGFLGAAMKRLGANAHIAGHSTEHGLDN